jgi:pyruvate,water dikinase
MARDILEFSEIDASQVALVGGKGAHLGELSRIEGVVVPPGFCITTQAFHRIVAQVPTIDEQIARLSRLKRGDREAIRAVSADTRAAIEAIDIGSDLAAAISSAVARLGEREPVAVRSSATAEDLPTASFAGQHDSYLNVVGIAAILQHISRCWASLFSERAVTYRLQHGVDHRRIAMAVVVQQMVVPEAAGILFTADPVSGNRKVASVEASFGLGEALVSGRVNADVYSVRDGEVLGRVIGTKQLGTYPSPAGGLQERKIEPERRQQPVLTDAQLTPHVQLGRRIEAHFGRPQDIEWCLADDRFQIVQSRPITTLFPVPEAGDREPRVYVSVGHAQMMTDAMKPLGISFWQMTAARPMAVAGGRLFVDVTQSLASPSSRAGLLEVMGKGDPLVKDALQTILDRGDFIRLRSDEGSAPQPGGAGPPPIETDPAIVTSLIERSQTSIAALQHQIAATSRSDLLDLIAADIQELKRVLFDPYSHAAIMAGMEASWWLNDRLEVWLGEKNAADVLTQSVAHNITSEMGLALLDVADAIRPHPEVVRFLQRVEDERLEDGRFLDGLIELEGGREARDAIRTWLDRYGMRCPGEIDITRPRWSERPGTLVPLMLGNVRGFDQGEAARRFQRGLREAAEKEAELLARLRALPDGQHKAQETKRMIDRVRTFAGYREYPKYGMISRYFVYRQALLEEAERLERSHVIEQQDDIFYLTFDELRDAVRRQRVDAALLRDRRDAFEAHRALVPPRVLTSDGEMLRGSYRRDGIPPGALVGLPVSAGTVEGRARIILDIADAEVAAGDILVTAYTDPSWTPLFVAIAGLVTEVGGLMTHGAVIAREYGLPTVVGVEAATSLIEDGQRIRVHGTDGYVEILP